MYYLTGSLKRIEDPESDRTFVRNESGDYFEEPQSELGNKWFKKLDLPLIVRKDIQEGVKGDLLI